MKENHIVSYDAMGDFLRELLRRNRISIKKAHLCMPIHEIYIRNVTLPMMNVQQLKVNLPYEFHDYITEDMGKYIYDYAMLPDMEGDGQLHMLAVAASKELISSHQQMAKRAHIKLESIQPANEALFRFEGIDKRWGLEVPPIVRLRERLASSGLIGRDTNVTAEGIGDALCQS